jgi:hypothetical protein
MFFAAAVVVLIAWSVRGCSSDECPSGASRCSNGTVEICAADGSEARTLVWTHQQTCVAGTLCVQTPKGALCTFNPQPAAECAQYDGPICTNNTVAACDSGYLILPIPVGGPCDPWTCKQEDYCVRCDDGSGVPDPTCALGAHETCFEGAVYDCECDDRVQKKIDCVAAGATCVNFAITGDGGAYYSSFCALSAQPDPKCSSPNLGYCTLSQWTSCFNGYAVERSTSVSQCP